MVEFVSNCLVTIPELDIKRKEAQLVKMASKRFRVWWGGLDQLFHYQMQDCDVSVPNGMVIVQDGTSVNPSRI